MQTKADLREALARSDEGWRALSRADAEHYGQRVLKGLRLLPPSGWPDYWDESICLDARRAWSAALDATGYREVSVPMPTAPVIARIPMLRDQCGWLMVRIPEEG